MTESITVDTVLEEPIVDNAEMVKLQAELDRIKKANDALSKENADHKRMDRERMTEEQVKEADALRKDEEFKQIRLELAKTKVETAFAKKGIEEAEYRPLADLVIELGGNASHDTLTNLANGIADLVSVREAKVAELTKTALLKDSIVHPKGDDNNLEVSDYKKFVDAQIKIPKEVKFND